MAFEDFRKQLLPRPVSVCAWCISVVLRGLDCHRPKLKRVIGEIKQEWHNKVLHINNFRKLSYTISTCSTAHPVRVHTMLENLPQDQTPQWETLPSAQSAVQALTTVIRLHDGSGKCVGEQAG